MADVLKSAVAGVLVAALAATAAAQSTAPADVIKARQANYKLLGGDSKTIMEQLKATSPDMTKIKAAAAQMKTLAQALPTWFPSGSGSEAGVKTAAKPEIWTDSAGFAAAAKKLADETAKLDQVAQGGDAAAIAAQFKATGMACGACHFKYRVKEQ